MRDLSYEGRYAMESNKLLADFLSVGSPFSSQTHRRTASVQPLDANHENRIEEFKIIMRHAFFVEFYFFSHFSNSTRLHRYPISLRS